MPRAPKKCGAAGCEARVVGRTYCALHTVPSPSSRADSRVPGERRRRAEAVASWVRVNGWVCPGWERDPHESRDLTAAHSTAVAVGGVRSLLSVLCRSCNSRQGDAPSRARQGL